MKDPLPLMYPTLFFLRSPSIPLVKEVTIPPLVYWTLPQFKLVFPTSIPIFWKSWLSS